MGLAMETIHQIAERATQIFVRQRLEGENDLGSLVIAIVTEIQAFDFSKSFYGELWRMGNYSTIVKSINLNLSRIYGLFLCPKKF
jgi:hypothetical protein